MENNVGCDCVSHSVDWCTYTHPHGRAAATQPELICSSLDATSVFLLGRVSWERDGVVIVICDVAACQ
jgi:hypothetical protein